MDGCLFQSLPRLPSIVSQGWDLMGRLSWGGTHFPAWVVVAYFRFWTEGLSS